MRDIKKYEAQAGEDERFFRDLFMWPPALDYEYHPSDRVLRAYLRGQLHDEWQFDEAFLPRLRRADLNGGWGLSEVSLHLLTCNHCCERIARLRAEELAELRRARGWKGRLWDRLRRLRGQLEQALTAGLAPLSLNLSLETGPVPVVSQALLYQYVRNGIEFQSSAFPLELQLRDWEASNEEQQER